MNFTVSTKPLQSALSIAVINSNVNVNYFQRSTILQITASEDTLYINVEAEFIQSEIRMKGVGDGHSAAIIVDCLLLKQLISTLTSPQITFEFQPTCLIVHAARSTYTIPSKGDASDMQLRRPANVTSKDAETGDSISKTDWKFIRDHQLYAKGTSYTTPVYTYVFVDENGDILVSDYVNGLFTHCVINTIGTTCLLSDTVINLFQSLPDGAKLISREDTYSIYIETDGYVIISEFEPKYESEEIGTYNAEIIMSLMHEDTENAVEISTSEISTALNQLSLLSVNKEFKVKCVVDEHQMELSADSTNCIIPIKNAPESRYQLNFRFSQLKSVISHLPDSTVFISPVRNIENGEISGFYFASDTLEVVLAGVN